MRILIIEEALRVSGPSKNIFQLYHSCQSTPDLQQVELLLASFRRGVWSPSMATGSDEFLQAATDLGIPPHRITEYFRFDPGTIRRLQRLVNLLSPDVIESHYTKSHVLVRLSGVWRRRPWIAFHHGYTGFGLRTRVYQHLDKWALQVPARVVSVCRAHEKQLILKKDSRFVVIHNAVRTAEPARQEQLVGLRRELGLQPEERIVLAVGRLSREKGFAELIVALQQLRQMNPEMHVRLLILGEGPQEKRIRKTVKALGLEQSVTLLGHVRDVQRYYKIADALAISSLSEGSPNVLLEAMAAGVPVAATAVGGIPEIADGESAVLVPPSDPPAMARALGLLLLDRERALQLASAARQLITRDHTPEKRARMLVDLYSRVYETWHREVSGSMALAGYHS